MKNKTLPKYEIIAVRELLKKGYSFRKLETLTGLSKYIIRKELNRIK